MPQFTNVTNSVDTSFGQAISHFLAYLPTLVGGLFVLALGWWIGGLIGRLLYRGLLAVGLEKAVAHSGFSNFLQKAGTHWTTTQIVAELGKWFVRIIFIQAAANILGMPQITQILNEIVLFIPRIIVAMVILVVGAVFARFLARAIRGSTNNLGTTESGFIANLVQYLVLGFSIIAAINQLGIAPAVVTTLVVGFVAAISLAVGLAFGLGSKDVAGQIANSWYNRSRSLKRTSTQPSESLRSVPENQEEFPPIKKIGT